MLVQKQDLFTGNGLSKGLPIGLTGGTEIDVSATDNNSNPIKSFVSYPLTRGLMKVLSESLAEVKVMKSSQNPDVLGISFTSHNSNARCWVYTEVINGVNILKVCGMPFGSPVVNFNFAIAMTLHLILNHSLYPNFIDSLKEVLKVKADLHSNAMLLAKLSFAVLTATTDILEQKSPLGISGIITERNEPVCLDIPISGEELRLAIESPEGLDSFISKESNAVEVPSDYPTSINESSFFGTLVDTLSDSIIRGKHCLLTGPTATGKTLAVEEACQKAHAPITIVRGCEGIEDRDLIGATILVADTSQAGVATKTEFVYGPVAKAVMAARNLALSNASVPAVLFIDEINRMQTRHQNLILSLLNIRKATNEYTLYIPDTGEELTCPNNSLVIIAARNIGASFAGTNQMDLALERRFYKKLTVDYLPQEDELRLVIKRTGISEATARVLTKVASDTRYQLSQLKAPLDTDSLLKWAEELACFESKGYLLNAKDALDTAKEIIFDICLDRDDRGSFEQASEAILTDNILESWKDEYKEAKDNALV